jgi:alkylhydroperoxidase family enzyme
MPELERAVLRASREATDGLRPSDEAFAVLRRHLSDEEVVDLVMTIAYYNLVVRVLSSLDVDLEPGYEGLLQEFPLDG